MNPEPSARILRNALVEHYRCANCWGMLVERCGHDGWRIECANAGQDHFGFVTASFVAYRRAVSHLEAAEVGTVYAAVLGLKRPDMAAASRALYGSDDAL